jgi:hypothetical protein
MKDTKLHNAKKTDCSKSEANDRPALNSQDRNRSNYLTNWVHENDCGDNIVEFIVPLISLITFFYDAYEKPK